KVITRFAWEVLVLKKRVKKLEKKKKSKSSGFKRLRKVGTDQRVEPSTDIGLGAQEDASKQGGKIEAIDANEGITLVDVMTNEEVVSMDVESQGRINQEEVNAASKEGMTYDKVRPIFERECKKVQTLFNPDKDVEEPKKKRVADETLLQESFTKLKAAEVKYPIIDWEIHIEGSRTYWKIIRVGGITEAYQSFEDMLRGFDREELVTLWNLVKEKFSSAVPKKDYPLSNAVMILMLSGKLQVEEDNEMARDLVMKIFIEANEPREEVWIHPPSDQDA
nr:hypothetical protein [Tanacetum cinerariifolium]